MLRNYTLPSWFIGRKPYENHKYMKETYFNKDAEPACNQDNDSCFGENTAKGFLYRLEQIINQRIDNNESNSYTNKLYREGINKIAQKVGEEAVELVIESTGNNKELFCNEAADLLYHFLILLKAKGCNLITIEEILKGRHKR